MGFTKATKKQAKLRLAISGPSGSGKTYTALALAMVLGKKRGLIDTERGSASKYADIFSFEVSDIAPPFNPEKYISEIHAAEQAGMDVLIIDSLTHAWSGAGGVLEVVDQAATRAKGNTYAGWREGTPLQNKLIDTILQSPCHIIATMRAKTEYALETNDRGKVQPKKIGMAPIQREGVEYEFDVSAFMDVDNNFCVEKTRCPALTGKVFNKPGKDLAQILLNWLSDGAVAPVVGPPSPAPMPSTGEPSSLDQHIAAGIEIITGFPFPEVAAKLKKHLEGVPESIRAKVKEELLKSYNERKAKES